MSPRLRPLDIADSPALAELMAAVEHVDNTEMHLDAKDVASRLADPKLDLATQSVAAFAGDQLVGYGVLRAGRELADGYTIRADGAVHPDWRRRGIGRQLLDWLIGRATEVAATECPRRPGLLHVFGHAGNDGKAAVLRATGFEPSTGWLDMQRSLADPIEVAPPPDGLRITGYTAELDDAVRRLHAEVFTGHWGSPPADPASWRQSYTGSRAFRPELSFVVLAGEPGSDEVVSYLLGYEWDAVTAATGLREVWMGQAGTAPRWRDQRCGYALVTHAVSRYAELGYDRAGLRVHTDNPNRVAQLRRLAGFEPTHRWHSHVRRLDRPDTPSVRATPELSAELRVELVGRQAGRESAARSYARSLPIAPTLASGAVVTGADGRSYLDCLSGAGSLPLGHNHPEVVAALRATLDSGAPLHALDMITPAKDAFTTELLAGLPGELRGNARVHFCGPAGTDAVEAALKLAQVATRRRGVVAFTGAYHGMTLGAVAVSGSARVRGTVGAESIGVTRIPYPYPYRCPFRVGGAQSARLSARLLASMLDDVNSGVGSDSGPPAAVIVEVVQGEGGVICGPDDWLRELRRITAERDILLILDEVQTGVGRTGSWFAFQAAGIVPDVVTLAKGLGGGLPIGACVGVGQAATLLRPGQHGTTFGGNPICCAAALAVLDTINRDGLLASVTEVGAALVAGIERIGHPLVGQVRGTGLLLGIGLTAEVAPALADAARCHGYLVNPVRPDTIRLAPPLVLSVDDARQFVDALPIILEEVAR